jgi:pimeloyl-ACP methyl ester carboxylesterase
MPTEQIHGYNLTYEERGNGEPLILVHGALSDLRNWRPQMEPFSNHFRTIAISLRHCWPELWNGIGDGYSISQHVADVVAFIETLGQKVHLVGHSRGGQVALLAALQMQHQIKHLVLAEPVIGLNPAPSEPEAASNANLMRDAVVLAATQVRNGDIEAGVKTFINCVGGPDGWEKRSPERRQIARDNAFTLIGLLTPPPPPVRIATLGEITIPTLPLSGEHTESAFNDIINVMQSKIKNAQRAIVRNAAHGLNRDNPTEFNRAVIDFLIGRRTR